tara:strand:+ start:406 stop:705 length:300 start_codon:yes stop_codon:yes gene_type:complete
MANRIMANRIMKDKTNHGVAIVFKRMDSHPEDFNTLGPRQPTRTEPRENKWYKFAKIIMDSRSNGFVTDEERIEFKIKFGEIQGNGFTAAVLEALMEDK